MPEYKVFLYIFIMDDGQENPTSPFSFSGEDVRFGKKVT
jgi:hypothetical protein